LGAQRKKESFYVSLVETLGKRIGLFTKGKKRRNRNHKDGISYVTDERSTR